MDDEPEPGATFERRHALRVQANAHAKARNAAQIDAERVEKEAVAHEREGRLDLNAEARAMAAAFRVEQRAHDEETRRLQREANAIVCPGFLSGSNGDYE